MPEALIVVDVQEAFSDPVRGTRSNPACEENVVALIGAWRRRGEPVVCETTARMGGNLGFEVRFVLDATDTFDRTAPDGTVIPAEVLMQVTAANLHDEFATVVATSEMVGR